MPTSPQALTRADFQDAQREQARQADVHHRDQLAAINTLAEEIRSMTNAMSQHWLKQDAKPVAATSSTDWWKAIAGMACIVFGLMAPMYIMLQSLSTDVTGMDYRMREDDLRERKDAASFARQTTTLGKIEQQMIEAGKDREQTSEREEGFIRAISAMNERVSAMERKMFGWPLPHGHEDQMNKK